MALLKNVILFVAAVSFVTFVALFGQLPALRRTPIGWLYRLLCIYTPRLLKHIDRVWFSGQVGRSGHRLGQYLFYQQNPIVLIIYLSILTVSAGLFLWNAVHLLPWSLIYPIPVLLFMPYYFTYASTTYRAHYITASTHRVRMHDYPYDYVLYKPCNTCSTCGFEKPARSKHCSLCGFCVAKADHHCPWVNNCLGRGNYRHFLALLLTLSWLEVYGAYLCYFLLRPHLRAAPPQSRLWDTVGVMLTVAVQKGGLSIAGVGLLAAWTAALPFGLFCYHAYLVWAGMTTNESQKWSDWRDDMADGHVFKAKRTAIEEHNQKSAQRSSDRSTRNTIMSIGLDGCRAPTAQWPVESDQLLVRTDDGKPPRGQETMWHRTWDLSDVDNIYDLGTRDNIIDVLCGR